MTIRDAKAYISDKLESVMDSSEANAAAKLILEEVKGYSAVEMLMYSDRELLPDTVDRIDHIVQKVIDGYPVQYALGVAWFHGRKFTVNPDVLIPRPETSQLVDIIIDRFKDRSDLNILDIGTGSGCIAVSLALDLPFASVSAVDISPAALATARINASNLKAKVDFIEADAFHLSECPKISGCSFDIIVSNPPYVLESERNSIDTRVKDHEPELALFVNDDKKVEIYAAIIAFAISHLSDKGMLFLEINPLCADDLRTLLKEPIFHIMI